jgi:V8-like Glu-specific endopeptidase
MILGKLTYCVADDGSFRREKWFDKYLLLVERLAQLVMTLVAFMWRLVGLLNQINFSWYYDMSQESQALTDVLLFSLVSLLAWRWISSERTLAPLIRKKGGDRYLGQVFGKDGVEHRVLIGGVEKTLKADLIDVSHKDEMAMPGSEYFPCRAQQVGAILVATETSDLRLFGTFWRLEDVLLTARHCSNTLYQTTAKIYLARIRTTKKGNYEIDRSKVVSVPVEFFSPDENLISSYNVDAFAKELDQPFWAKLGLGTVSTKVRSAYGLNVHSVGFTPDGLLVSASGRTLKDSGFEMLHHTASTQQGFSGSILVCGNSVVGMHVCAADGHNVAIRVEYLEYLLAAASSEEAASKNRKRYTYADAAYKDHFREHKYKGGVASIMTMRDGNYSIILQNGEATYGWSMGELIECFGSTGNHRKDEDIFLDMMLDEGYHAARHRLQDKGSPLQDIQFDDDYDRYQRDPSYRNSRNFVDDNTNWENVPIAPKVGKRNRRHAKTSVKEAVSETLPKSKPKDGYDWLYTERSDGKPIHGPSPPKLQPEAVQVIELFRDKIKELGFAEGTMMYPTMTPAEEKISLRKHLQLFGDRVKSIKVTPSEVQVRRIVSLVTDMLAPAAYVPDSDYNQVSGAMNVINSTIINCKKSSGYPYVLEGLPTNGKVLEHYGVQGFAQHCVNSWLRPIVLKFFEKGEPTKKSKIDEGMPRGIAGLPVDALVNHACIFKNFFTNLIHNWKELPVKYAFNPASTGHIEHLKSVLPGKVWESDKEKWDFNFHEWIVDITCQVVQNLAVRNPEWSEDQFATFKMDVRKAFDQVFNLSKYRTSDGTLFEMKVNGIMKSGWFGTIGGNTIAQIVHNVAVLVVMELPDERIMDLATVAGGDDVLQDLGGVDIEKYKQVSADMGVRVELVEREALESSEYFSSDIRVDKEGKFTYFPKRFTKHIEHLKTVKLEDLANALCSHMENYRHDREKFMLFENIYHKLRETHPLYFPISNLKNRDLLVGKQYGYERLGW